MNDLPRQKLKQIITQYGRTLSEDPKLCEALLRDFCGQYRKEINVIVIAIKEGVATDLLNSQNSVPSNLLLARMTKRLADRMGMSPEVADWVVDTWALALGIISESSLSAKVYNLTENSVKVESQQQQQQTQTKSWQCIKTIIGHHTAVRCVAISPDRQFLVSGSDDSTIKIWDLTSGNLIRTIEWKKIWGESEASWVTGIAIAPDNQTIASSNLSKFVKVWDIDSGKLIRKFRGHSDSLHSVMFSPDGQTLVSSSRDKTVKVWDFNTGKTITTCKGHSDSVYSVAISPDGKTIVSGSRDRQISIWNSHSGENLKTLDLHSDWVRSVAISPDGKICASGSCDRTIALWDLNRINALKFD